MPHKHGALFDTTNKAILAKPPCKQGALFSATSKVSMKKSEAPRKTGVLSDTAGNVFAKKGKVIPSSESEAIGEGEGSWTDVVVY